MPEARPYDIPKQLVWEAYQRVRANRGAPGVDAIETKALISGLREVRETACKLPGRWPAQRRREPSAGSCAERGNLRHDDKGDLQVVDPREAEYRCVVQGRTGS